MIDPAAQLFGIMSHSPLGLEETLVKLQKIGFSYIEPCLAMEPIPGFEKAFWPKEVFSAQVPLLRSLGLQLRSAHIVGADLLREADWLLQIAREHGIRFYVVKVPQDLDRASLDHAAADYCHLADVLADAGIRLALHNDAEEIERRVDGISAYEYLINRCQGKLYAQVDIGWMHYAGEDVLEFLERQKERVLSIHYKDFDAQGQPAHIGQGAVKVESIARATRAWNLWPVLETALFTDKMFQDLEETLARMRAWG